MMLNEIYIMYIVVTLVLFLLSNFLLLLALKTWRWSRRKKETWIYVFLIRHTRDEKLSEERLNLE